MKLVIFKRKYPLQDQKLIAVNPEHIVSIGTNSEQETEIITAQGSHAVCESFDEVLERMDRPGCACVSRCS